MKRQRDIYYVPMMEEPMNDRGGMHMIGKTILILALLAIAGIAWAIYQWSDHSLKDAQAYGMVARTDIQIAKDTADLVYEPQIAAAEAAQKLEDMANENEEAEAYHNRVLAGLLEDERLVRETNNQNLAFRQMAYTLGMRFIFIAATATVTIAAILIGYVLFKKVEVRYEPVARQQTKTIGATAPRQATTRPQTDRPVGQPMRQPASPPQPIAAQSNGRQTPVAERLTPAILYSNGHSHNGHSHNGNGYHSNGHGSNGHNLADR